MTDAGIELFARIGIDVDGPPGPSRQALRADSVPALPRLERAAARIWRARSGAALCAHSFDKGWIRRIDGTRAVAITPKGQRIFREQLGVRLE